VLDAADSITGRPRFDYLKAEPIPAVQDVENAILELFDGADLSLRSSRYAIRNGSGRIRTSPRRSGRAARSAVSGLRLVRFESLRRTIFLLTAMRADGLFAV
jgi:hypothetical protein